MYEPIQIRYSRKKVWWGFSFGVLITLVFLSPGHRGSWGWTVYCILLLLNSLYLLKALFNREAILVIDDRGICDHRLGSVPISWKRIDSISVHGERIFLNMTDTSHLGWEESRLSVFHKPITKITRDGVLIDARGLEYDSDHIAEVVVARLEYYKAG